MPPAHKVNITSWLLGFVEGDGSFFMRRDGQLVFYISQKGNKALLEAIQEYLLKKNMAILLIQTLYLFFQEIKIFLDLYLYIVHNL